MAKKIVSIQLFIISFVFYFLSFNTTSVLANVFLNNGKDPRVSLTSNENFPLNTIGMLDSGCIATLLSNKIAITSSHCVITDKGDLTEDLKSFIISGKKVGIEKIFAKTKDFPSKISDPELLNDWALVVLEDNTITSSLEFMSLEKVEFQQISQNPDLTYNVKSLFPYEVGFVGLDMDLQKLMYDRSCFIFKQESGLLYHNCSSTSGGSGGSLFSIVNKTPKIVALMIAEKRQGANTSIKAEKYSNLYANIAIPVQDEMISAFNELNQAISNGTLSKDIELTPPIDLIAINFNDVKRMNTLPRASQDDSSSNVATDNSNGSHSILEQNNNDNDNNNNNSGYHSILERNDNDNNTNSNVNANDTNTNGGYHSILEQPQQVQSQQPVYQDQYRVTSRSFELYARNYQKVIITTNALITNLDNLTKTLRRQFLTKAASISDAAYNEAIFIQSTFIKSMNQPRDYWYFYLDAITKSVQRIAYILDDLTNHLISINRIKTPIRFNSSNNYQSYTFRDLFSTKIPLRIPNNMLTFSLSDVGIAFFSVEKMFR